MLQSIGPIYNTLFEAIEGTQAAGGVMATFERGFWYTEEDELEQYPYGFLHQPSWSELEYHATPNQDRFQVYIELVILTKADTPGALFFPETPRAEPTGKAAIELLIAIGKEISDQYTFGFPFVPIPEGWYVERWHFGPGGRPTHPVLQTYLDNPRIAGASVTFVFDVVVNGPLPHNI